MFLNLLLQTVVHLSFRPKSQIQPDNCCLKVDDKFTLHPIYSTSSVKSESFEKNFLKGETFADFTEQFTDGLIQSLNWRMQSFFNRRKRPRNVVPISDTAPWTLYGSQSL